MTTRDLEFERPVVELERQIEALRRQAAGRDQLASIVAAGPFERDPGAGGAPAEIPSPFERSPDQMQADEERTAEGDALHAKIAELETTVRALKEEIFAGLNRWDVVQVARHPDRPYTLDYLKHAFSDFVELHGDRRFADDPAIVCGLARLDGRAVVVIGHQKGRTTKDNVRRNFGMPRPEGYRKAIRLMKMAEKFSLPIVSLIDTPGAYPGLGAEERGQAQAIAEALECMAGLSVPVVSVVIGEGGSGGALAIGVANRVLILQYATYSVISPEGCASILFKDASRAPQAADALKLTAPDLVSLGVVDGVVEEPLGGAHRDPAEAGSRLRAAVVKELYDLSRMDAAALRTQRYDRFRGLGKAVVASPAPPERV